MCRMQLASLAALLLAWLFVFDITNKERASLEGFREGIVGAVPDPAQSQVLDMTAGSNSEPTRGNSSGGVTAARIPRPRGRAARHVVGSRLKLAFSCSRSLMWLQRCCCTQGQMPLQLPCSSPP